MGDLETKLMNPGIVEVPPSEVVSPIEVPPVEVPPPEVPNPAPPAVDPLVKKKTQY